MTDPSSKTVRGWLVDLVNATVAESLTPVLAELRHLNRALVGRDAAGVVLDQNEVPTLGGALYVRSLDAQGELLEALPLASYLLRKIGRATSNASLEDHLVSSFLALQVLRDSVTTNSAPDGSLLRRVNEKLGSVELGETYETISMLGAARSLVLIRRLLSQLPELAEGNDIYSALISINDNTRRSAECCEEANGGAGENPPPTSTGSCEGWGEYIRMSSYVFVADVDDGAGGDLQTLYDIEFDFSGQPWFQALGTSGGRVYYEIAGTSDLTLEVCHARNFTGEPACRTSGPDFGQTIADATDSSYTVGPDGLQVQEIGFTVDIGDGPGESRFFGFSAQFPRGVVPPKNIFLKARYVVS